MLSRREYTAAELRTRLLAREHTEEDVAAALASLTEDRLLDDRRVAISHVRVAASVKGRGRLRIARELEARGVDKAILREAMATLPPEDETEAIRRVLRRKALPRPLTAQDHRRLFGQLLRRGFSADFIARALKEHKAE
jgi:regulatory protein